MARRFAVPNPPEAQPESLILRGMFNTGSTGFLLPLPMVPDRFQLARERGRGPLSGGGDLDCERALLRVVCIPSTASAAGSCRYLQCATVVLALSAGPNDGSDDGDCRITPLSPGPPHVTCTTAPAQRRPQYKYRRCRNPFTLRGWGPGRPNKAQTHRRLGPLEIGGDFKLRLPDGERKGGLRQGGCGKLCGWGRKLGGSGGRFGAWEDREGGGSLEYCPV